LAAWRKLRMVEDTNHSVKDLLLAGLRERWMPRACRRAAVLAGERVNDAFGVSRRADAAGAMRDNSLPASYSRSVKPA